MLASEIPTKFPLAFGADAGPSYIRVIPTASQIGVQPGAASLTDGFPPLTFTPDGGGGVPPFGQDFNGLLNQITAWTQWQNAGGPIAYDAGFSTSIGGYPQGAVLAAATLGSFWLSTADNNTSDPDTGGANWVGFTPVNLYAVDSGTANAGVATLSPAPASLAFLTGWPIRIKKASAANSGAFTLNLNSFGPTQVVHADGSALGSTELPANGIFSVCYDGTSFELQSTAGGNITLAQLQIQSGNSGLDTGSANALVVTLSPVPASLASINGSPLRIQKGAAPNTGAVTLALNSLTAKAIIHGDGTALQASELPAVGEFSIIYNTTADKFILQSVANAAAMLLPNSVANAALAQAAPNTLKGNNTGGTANVADLTAPQVQTFLGVSPGIGGTFKNLKIVNGTTGAYGASNITIDESLLENSSGGTIKASIVSLTPNLSTTGANHLDTGTQAANTWYSLWIIYNPTSVTVAALYSLSATSPTLPSGYTYKARIGWARTNAGNTGFAYPSLQYGRQARIAAPPVIASGNVGGWSTTTPTWVAEDVTPYVPTTASMISIMACNTASGNAAPQFAVAPNNSYGGISSANPPPVVISIDDTSVSGSYYPRTSMVAALMLESTNIYAVSNGNGVTLSCYGWEDNL